MRRNAQINLENISVIFFCFSAVIAFACIAVGRDTVFEVFRYCFWIVTITVFLLFVMAVAYFIRYFYLAGEMKLNDFRMPEYIKKQPEMVGYSNLSALSANPESSAIADTGLPTDFDFSFRPEKKLSGLDILIKQQSVVLSGDQGAGKTTLLCHMMNILIKAGEQVVVADPHGFKNKYPKEVVVCGLGTDYTGINRMFQKLVALKKQRYEKMAETGQEKFYPVAFFCDEYTLLDDKVCPDINDFVGSFLTEFRKVCIRVVLVSHSVTAGTLNLRGRYDLAEGIIFCHCVNELRTGERYLEIRKGMKGKPERFEHPGRIERVKLDEKDTVPEIENTLKSIAGKGEKTISYESSKTEHTTAPANTQNKTPTPDASVEVQTTAPSVYGISKMTPTPADTGKNNVQNDEILTPKTYTNRVGHKYIFLPGLNPDEQIIAMWQTGLFEISHIAEAMYKHKSGANNAKIKAILEHNGYKTD